MLADFAQEEGALSDRSRQAVRDELAKKGAADIAARLKTRKTAYGARIAGAFGNFADAGLRVPQAILAMLDFIRPPAPAGGTSAPGAARGS
jgi:hypothetical protein